MLYVKYGKNRLRMSFEKVDRRRDGWTMDAYLYYELTNEPMAQES